MKRYVFRLSLVLTAVLVSVAQSRADKVPVSGEIVGGDVVDPGELTITPGGIVIIQGQVTEEVLDGDLAGTVRVSLTFMVNFHTGEGHMFGHIDLPDPNGNGGFRGPFGGDVSGAFGPGEGGFDGYWRLSGYGTHQGETALIHNFGPFSGANQVYEGVIVGP